MGSTSKARALLAEAKALLVENITLSFQNINNAPMKATDNSVLLITMGAFYASIK